jgi:hypothetical protein
MNPRSGFAKSSSDGEKTILILLVEAVLVDVAIVVAVAAAVGGCDTVAVGAGDHGEHPSSPGQIASTERILLIIYVHVPQSF